MAKFIFVGTHGPEDSSRASFPFLQAATAVAEGHQASIVLYGEGSLLMKDPIAENLHGLGLPSFKDLLEQVKTAKIPIFL
jgi:predicted peroxiredoxin